MNAPLRILCFVSFALACGCSEKQVDTPRPPRILRFEADRPELRRGQSVRLSYEVEGAAEVTLLDDSGAEVSLNGSPAQGDATLSPERSTFYVLRATGEGGRDVGFTQVAV